MNFKEYQTESRKTAIYPNLDNNIYYPAMGLAGEVGEVLNKIKKIMRDDNDVVSDAKRVELSGEIGDVLWYVANLATELGISLDDVASNNLDKLQSRMKRNVLTGSGDKR